MDNNQSIPLSLTPASGKPIYQQLKEQIVRLIMSNNLLAETKLPSIRNLAVELEINPMTISKAYQELESEGYLERISGVGMIVRHLRSNQQDLEARIRIIEPKIEQIVEEAKQLNINKTRLLEAMNLALDKHAL